MKALAEIERALARDDEEAALAAALEAWRAMRSPELAAVIDVIGLRLDRAMPPAFGGKRAELHDAWMAIARDRRPADWPRLVREIVLTANRFGVAVVDALCERARAIVGWPADPRTADLVIEHLGRPGYQSSSSSTYPYWTALCDLLVAHGDPSTASLLAELDYSQIFRVYSDRKKATVWFEALHAATLERLRATAAPVLLARPQREAWGKLAKQLAKRAPVSDAQRARLVRAQVAPAPKPVPKRKPATHDGSAMQRHLATALEAAETGDDLRTLDELLAAWRGSRSPKVAKLIDAMTHRLRGHGAELEGGKRAEMQARWLEVAAEGRAVDLPALVANITTTYGRSTDALARVEVLAGAPADPRTGPIIAKILKAPTFYASSTKPFWTALIRLAVEHGDMRTLAELEALTGRFAKILRQTYTDTSSIARWFEGQVAAACTELRARPPVTDPDDATCARIMKSFGANVADKLLAEVHAHPADTAAHQVLGDVLQQRGDPRGELIALQLSGKDPGRVAKLIAKHGRGWLGPVADHVDLARCRFEHGFPVELAMVTTPSDADELVDDPVWATVTRVDLGDMGRLPHVLLREARRIEHLGGLGRKLFNQLLSWDEVPYASIGLAFELDAGEVDRLIAARKKLSSLRALELDAGIWPREIVRVFESPLVKQIEQVTLVDLEHPIDWFGALRVGKVPRIRARLADGGSIEIDRGAATTDLTGPGLDKFLKGLEPGFMNRLRVARPATVRHLRLLEQHAKELVLELEFKS